MLRMWETEENRAPTQTDDDHLVNARLEGYNFKAREEKQTITGFDELTRGLPHAFTVPAVLLGDYYRHSWKYGADSPKALRINPYTILGATMTGVGNTCIDQVFFNGQPPGLGFTVGEFTGLVIATMPLPWRYKAPLMIGTHIAGRLADKYNWLGSGTNRF